MTNPISQTFKNLKLRKKPALLTYTVAGDDTKKRSLDILKSISKYADICELGFPHNTPIADGGQIQTSSYRAIKNGIKISDVFRIVKKFKTMKTSKPLILMGYYNMNGIIVVDLPWPENISFSKKCKKQNICFVQLISPTTTINRAKKIIKSSHDMIYYISMLSTTGGKLKISTKKILSNYKKIKNINPKKNYVIGFGITEKTISQLITADGLVVGSAICREISKSLKKRQNPVINVDKIVFKLKNKIS